MNGLDYSQFNSSNLGMANPFSNNQTIEITGLKNFYKNNTNS